MTPDNNQTLPANDEPPAGSGPDGITAETPTCPAKNVQCPYYSEGGCQVAVCRVETDKTEKK